MQQKGLTQAELARRLGKAPQSVAPILKGRRGKQPESLLEILDLLDLELEVRPKGAKRLLAPELAQALEQAGALEVGQGRGKPKGGSFALRRGGLVSATVVAARNEDERDL